MPYVAPLGVTGSMIGLFFAILIAFTKNFTVFIGKFDYVNFITGYLGIPLYFIMFVGYKVIKRSRWIPLEQCDFFTGKDKIDEEERLFLQAKEAKMNVLAKQGGFKWFYERFLGLIF